MRVSRIKNWQIFRSNWEKVALFLILATIVALNFRPGYFILGNDNYSPEESPLLSFNRYLFSPAWRDYRGLGVPSDAEQVDIFRSLFFLGLQKLGLPLWLISQTSIWFVFLIGIWSAASLGECLLRRISSRKVPGAFLFSGVFYFTNMLTIFLFFSPLKPFIFVWGFLPFFLWRSLVFILQTNLKNFAIFILSVIFITLAAIIPTIFLVALGVSFFYFFWLAWLGLNKKKILFVALFFFLFQLFWLLPFAFYAKSNATSLQESYINRMITPNTILIEEKYNTLKNVFRYHTFWLDNRNDNGTLVFPYGLAYQTNKFLVAVSFLPVLWATIAFFYLLTRKRLVGSSLILLLLAGGFFIKGDNEPLGSLYRFFQENIPLFRQVFRWGSSKFWPLLALSLPFLASLGVGVLAKRLKRRPLRYLLILATVGFQLAFVFPFFRGELVNRREFVKIPRPYFELRRFLTEEELTKKRIYAAPESNMLYFRNHQWGFYGSVFLNYFLPNPVIEKALITGSPENEDIFFNLVNAYYSENPRFFAQALALAKAELVLADKSVTGKGNGYRYNWRVHQKVVENNPWLKKIWQNEFLSLYQVAYPQREAGTELVYEFHRWRVLQKKKITQMLTPVLVSSADRPGSIYPLALKADKVQASPDDLTLIHTYQGLPGRFSPSLPAELISALPTKLILTNKHLLAVPALPRVLVNDQELDFSPSLIKTTVKELPSGTEFVSLRDMIWPLNPNKECVFQTALKEATEAKAWQDRPQKVAYPSRVKIDEDSIVEFDLQVKAVKPGWYNFCLESENLKKCLNKNTSFWADQEERIVSLSLPMVIKAPDELIFWPSENNPDFRVKEVRLYQKSVSVALIPQQEEVPLSSPTVELHSGDQIKVQLPRVLSPDTYYLEGRNYAFGIPEIFATDGVKIREGQVSVEAKSGPAGFYLKFAPLTQSNQLMLFAAGTNNLFGIPLDFNFRDVKQEYKIWQERAKEQGRGEVLDVFLTPKELHNYILEAYLYSQGKKPSVNLVDFLLFQPLPRPWLALKLEPLQKEDNLVIKSNNQAFHPYWRVNKGEKVRLNGWEQAVVLKENSSVKFSFWPNWLSWAGLALDFMLVGTATLWLLRQKKEV